MDEILAVFSQEARELLASMEADLLRLEQDEATASDVETLNAIFRAAHTIKGAAGVVEATAIEGFTHGLENILDRLRNHEIQTSAELISCLLLCCDHLGSLLDALTEPERLDQELIDTGTTLSERLRAAARLAASEPATQLLPDATAPSAPQATDARLEAAGETAALHDCWHISVRFGINVLRNGMDPESILRYLQSLGEIVHLTTLADHLPPAEEMDPEACYLGFEISFKSNANKAQIERVFAFVMDDCVLHILPPEARLQDYLQLIQALPEEPMRLGEILVQSGAITAEELQRGLIQQLTPAMDATDIQAADANREHAPPRLGEILVEQKQVQPELVTAAADKQRRVQDKKAEEARLIRVHAGKLDHLIDRVGELVIAGASAHLLAQNSGLGALVEATSILERLVEDIRDAALQLRMVQIGETFNRYHRVVRDTARELGKDIELLIHGAETELDKSVVEKIADPLMHLVRNAIDHGLEAPAVRLAQDKPATGRLLLNAFHDSGSIVIEIRDDGAGLNRQKILAKAIERGLVSQNQNLSDREIQNLIFEAGFSTAETVTNLSGRGVGMDVVRRNIQALRGSVDVDSIEGEGTCFTIRLPLTLAIIDGFLVTAGPAAYVIPLEMVVECLELKNLNTGRNYLDLRGEMLPFLRLRELFALPGQPPRRENVVVIKAGAQKLGIVVDELQGEFQTVIKPLGQLFRHLRGISGSTILGSGAVAMILDVASLAQLACHNEERALAEKPPWPAAEQTALAANIH